MNDVIVGGILIALGLVLQANDWFVGHEPVGVVLIVFGGVVAGLELLRRLGR